MTDNPKSKTDKLLFRIKDNRYFAPIIVFGIITSAIITFWLVVKPFILSNDEKIKEIVKQDSNKKEFGSFDFVLQKFIPDTLISKKAVHSFVSRRDFEMHFIISNNWDLDEPLDGPAGLRFKSYYMPKNGKCTITALADIACFDDIIDTLGNASLDKGFCSFEDFITSRMEYPKKNYENFVMLFNTPSLKTYVENKTSNYQIETRRIKYKYKNNGEDYFTMELLTYIGKIGFVLQLVGPEKEYSETEDLFISLTNNIYYKKIGLD